MAQDMGDDVRASRLAARLAQYPELCARFEEILAVAENERGDANTADEAEGRAVEQVRRLGQELMQTWAERKQERLVREYDARCDTRREGKKTPLADPVRRGQPRRADLSAARGS